ncbi:MAG: sel1 repeat family protein [Nitrospiraceae bacterium]|nr:sel1 repeat family protein [Nitrospiraceae bacterium]
MNNRTIGLCIITVFVASCSSSPSRPLSQEGSAQPSTRGSIASPVRTLHSLAEQGNVEAQFNLGLLYDQGRGLPKDKTAALRWYRRAAMQGDMFAQNALGDNYWEGTGAPKDDREAVRWWRLAADKGFVPAQHSLGKILAGGSQGVSADRPQAYMWLMLSAAQGDEEAGRQSDLLSKQLKPAEMTIAKKLVNQWKPVRASATLNKTAQ